MNFKSSFRNTLEKICYLPKFCKAKTIDLKKSVACHKNLMSDLNSTYQNYVSTSVRNNAISFLLACVIDI